MAFEIQDLDNLDPVLVAQMLEQTRTRLQEAYPEMDLKRGPFHDQLLYPHSVLESAMRTNLARYLSARSLLEIERDPTLADDEVVDSVLSLYNLTRQPGTNAFGKLTVVVSDSTSVTISAGSVWVANGQEFAAVQTFVAKPELELIAHSGDRLMTQLSDGNYGFQIDVVALEVGPASRLAKDAKVLPEAQPGNYVTSYATQDFQGGESLETNDELLGKMETGLAAKALSNEINMEAALRDVEAFARITALSILGMGDAEMLRDQHSIFPLSYGGRTDWYVRGQPELLRTTLIKTAVLVSKEADGGGIWQTSVGRDDAPGFFEIRNIRLSGANAADVSGGFEITAEQRGLDLTGSGFRPDIETQAEGAYSRYQTAVVQFKDTLTDVSALNPGDTQVYEVEATGTPLIAEIQDYVAGRSVRHFGADALVKAPVPCFVQVTLSINKRRTDDNPDLEGIAQAIMDVVNGVLFIGRLDASRVMDAVHGFLTNSMSVTKMDLFGRIRRPDGSVSYVRDPESLEVPDEPAAMVTAKTVQFFLERSSISINVENTLPVYS